MKTDNKKTDNKNETTFKVLCAILFFVILFLIHHYDKQRDRADILEEQKTLSDTIHSKDSLMITRIMDTLDNYYLVNKMDVKLQKVIKLDNNSIQQITINPTEK